MHYRAAKKNARTAEKAKKKNGKQTLEAYVESKILSIGKLAGPWPS
jgi:hypothetical protein